MVLLMMIVVLVMLLLIKVMIEQEVKDETDRLIYSKDKDPVVEF
jgi:hypothetical protein